MSQTQRLQPAAAKTCVYLLVFGEQLIRRGYKIMFIMVIIVNRLPRSVVVTPTSEDALFKKKKSTSFGFFNGLRRKHDLKTSDQLKMKAKHFVGLCIRGSVLRYFAIDVFRV